MTGRFAILAGGGSAVLLDTGLNVIPTKFIAFPDNTSVPGYQPISYWRLDTTNPANIFISFAGNVTSTQAYSYIAE